MGNLNDTKLKSLKPKEKDYAISDGNGLQVLVKPNKKKKWEFIYTSPTVFNSNGKKKRRKTTFGYYPDTSLKVARDRASECLDLIARGIDPIDQKAQDKKNAIVKVNSNFKTITDQWLEFEQGKTTEATHRRKKSIIYNDALPYLQSKLINEISHQDILKVLKSRLTKKIPTAKSNTNAPDGIETANKLYNYLNTIFKYAITLGLADKNPFDNILKELVIPKASVTHHPKITDTANLKKLVNDIYSYDGHYSTVNALKLAIHIPLRSANLVNLHWDYIDFEENSLTIPRNEMKIKNKNLPDFKVPLSEEVVNILKDQFQLTSHQKYVFLSNSGKPINGNTPNLALTRMGYKNTQTLHGFRGIFRSLADTHQKEHGLEYEVKRRFLDHHDENKVEQAYNHRAEYFEQMIPLVQWWSNYLTNLKD